MLEGRDFDGIYCTIIAVYIYQAAYLQKAGLDVCVLERRHLIGGAAVTEEIVPGLETSHCQHVFVIVNTTKSCINK